MDLATTIINLSIVLLLSFLFGIERQRHRKPIGFGTFIFVATGSCALAITATTVGKENPLSLLGAIVTGIGFLGAGALIKTTDRIFGFTSAATIWIFAIMGLLIGLQEYFLGFFLYLTIWLVTLFDRHLEQKGKGSYERKLTINTNKIIDSKEIDAALGKRKYKVVVLDVNKKLNTMTITYQIGGTKEEINQIPKRLFTQDWFESFKSE